MGKFGKIIPTILCGGKGSRLWPLSSSQTPKHFLHFGHKLSLFQRTMLRCANKIFDHKPIIVTNRAYRDEVNYQLGEIGAQAEICLEPFGKNSCPAIIYACLSALEREIDPTLLVLPADHMIDPEDAFNELVGQVYTFTKTHLLTFGLKPKHPHTGYGYIEPGQPLKHGGSPPVFKAKRFVEKPDDAKAKHFCDQGYLWNSGIFLINVKVFLEEVSRLQPELFEQSKSAYINGCMDNNVREIDSAVCQCLPSLSVDKGVFELSDKVAVCVADVNWCDIGNWDRAATLFPKREANNRVEGYAQFCESADNFVHSPFHKTCLVGVDNLAVVVTKDSVLVTHRAKCEKTGLISQLEDQRDIRIDMYRDFDQRPWGGFHRIDLGEGYQVKRLRVEPGQSLSLQSHAHRSEHWIVVSGTAQVTLGDTTKLCHQDESVYIPKGSIHRLANTSKDPLILIEVQTGDYLGEDDIVRIDDIYDRVKK